MKRLWATFQQFSFFAKLGVGLGVLLLLALLFALGSWIGGMGEARRVKKLEAQMASQTQELEQKRAHVAELEEEVAKLNLERAKLTAIKDAAGAQAKAAEKEVENVEKQIEEDIARTGEPVPDDVRMQRIRERLAERKAKAK